MTYKRLQLFIILLITLPCQGVFANTHIDFTTKKDHFDISEIIEVALEFTSDEELSLGEITIPGIENFHIIGQQQNQLHIFPQGKSEHTVSVLLSLKAKFSGSYSLGPLSIGNDTSKKIELTITGEDILTGGSPLLKTDTQKQYEAQQEAQRLEQEKIENKRHERKHNEAEILDIHDQTGTVKTLADIHPNSSIGFINWGSSALSFLILGCIILLYYIAKYVQEKILNKNILTSPLKEETHKKRMDYYSLLEEVDEKYITSPKSLFYAEVAKIMRQYLDDQFSEGLSSCTLIEIQTKLSEQKILAKLYEEIYYPEYNTETDSRETRNALIENLKNELK